MSKSKISSSQERKLHAVWAKQKKATETLVKGDIEGASRLLIEVASEFNQISSNNAYSPGAIISSFNGKCVGTFKKWHHATTDEKIQTIRMLGILPLIEKNEKNENFDNVNEFMILLHHNVAFRDVFLQVFAYVLFLATENCTEINIPTVGKVGAELFNLINKGPEWLFATYAILNVVNPELRSEQYRDAYKNAIQDLFSKLVPKTQKSHENQSVKKNSQNLNFDKKQEVNPDDEVALKVSWKNEAVKTAGKRLSQKLNKHGPVFMAAVKDIVHSGFWDQLKRIFRNTINLFSSIITRDSSDINKFEETTEGDRASVNSINSQSSAKMGVKNAAVLNTIEDITARLDRISPPSLNNTASPT